jgi:phage gp46-like protein
MNKNPQDFEGDLLLHDGNDFGEIDLEDGLFVSDRSFNTAVYISLFGGNKDDNGKVKNNKTWWGNTLEGTAENEKLVSRFQAVIFGLPMTTKNIQDAETAASLDLKWLINEGVADKIIATGKATGRNRFALTIDIQSGGKSIYENTFPLFWRSGIYGNTI